MSSDEDTQGPGAEELMAAIRRILSTENLEKLSAKRVRQQLSEEFNTDLSDRKSELDSMIMKCVEEIHAAENGAPSKATKRRSAGGQASTSKKARKRSDSEGSAEDEPKKQRGPKKGQSIYSLEMILSPELASIMGVDKMARKDVVKRMWQIFKERELQDPGNKQYVVPDKELSTVFGDKKFRAFGLMKYLKNHLKDPRHLTQ